MRELGEARQESPPAEFEQAYRTLLDPLAELCVGTSVGDHGDPPPGRAESQALVAAGRFDLLRGVLRGPNAEARVYAAHALLERGAAHEDDVATIEVLSRLSLRVMTCGGCLVGEGDWEHALAQLRGP